MLLSAQSCIPGIESSHLLGSWLQQAVAKQICKMFEDEYEQRKGRNKRRREGKGRRKQPEMA